MQQAGAKQVEHASHLEEAYRQAQQGVFRNKETQPHLTNTVVPACKGQPFNKVSLCAHRPTLHLDTIRASSLT